MIVINGRKFSSSDVNLILLGRLVIGFKSITYKDNVDVEDVPSAGEVPYGYTKGNYKAEGSVELYMDELEGIRSRLPKGMGITSIPPFVITVTYVNEDNITCTHSFTARFKGDGQNSENGNNNALSTQIDLKIIGRIKWN